MSKAIHPDQLRSAVRNELRAARAASDKLFGIVLPGALKDRPIPERHRLIFYLGHLEVFDWNIIGRDSFGLESLNPAFDELFAFGIDPVRGDLPQDSPDDWPSPPRIQHYTTRIRDAVDRCLERAEDFQLFWLAIEHRYMHVETLTYMLHWMDYSKKTRLPTSVSDPPAPSPSRIEIPAGTATLGFTKELQAPFGWDNEFEPLTVSVPAFSIDAYNVTNGQFIEFIDDGGYEDPSLKWLADQGIQHPKSWRRRNNSWWYRTMFAEIPLPKSWPVYVSQAEAAAYARWAGRSLPTEGQFHRAAFGTPGGERAERVYPWGNSAPAPERGNFNFKRWNPTPVGAHSAGNSAFGVSDLVGNGWEWTSTVFAPFPGFKSFPAYPGYSAGFFDGRHYVLKGASPRTAWPLLRRSFRNWFQPHYPNIYATFRCTDN